MNILQYCSSSLRSSSAHLRVNKNSLSYLNVTVPDVDLPQSRGSGAYYTVDLRYGRLAEVALSRGQKQGMSRPPGHSTISGSARAFVDDLALVTKSDADITLLLQAFWRFCKWFST